MFTGIITDIGTLVAVKGGVFEIACHYKKESIALGASIACDGCCLTVTELIASSDQGCHFLVDVSNETKSVTTLKDWHEGRKINLERALKMGDEFGGHIVSGHVDGLATITDIKADGASTRFKMQAPEGLKQFIAPKGSVCLNGVSLTVNEVEDTSFGVNIIPHTLQQTCWQYMNVGDNLNLEVDLLARYAVRASQALGLYDQ